LGPPKYRIKNYDQNRIDAIYNDNLSSIEQLGYFTQNTGMLIGSFTKENLTLTEFKIFKELLFKWEKIYLHEARRKRIDFIIPSTHLSDEKRPLIVNDKKRLEQLIYNLVNNAMKYSYWRTKIYIDCKLMEEQSEKQCLTVIDYGHKIAEGDIPYELYYRDTTLVNKKVEGSGIGLYVAREVALLIGVELRHKPSFISDYNVPLIPHYLKMTDSNNDLHEKISAEYDRLSQNGLYDKIVSSFAKQNSPTNEQIINEINNKTYQVEFEVII
jgi:hypothetical protein